MIKSFKAILAGFLFIVIVILVMQLLYIFLAVGFHSLASSYPALNSVTGLIKYLVGIPVLMLVIFGGGYISAAMAPGRPVLHGLIVAVLSSAVMILPTLENAQLTPTGMVVFALVIMAGGAGGLYWQKSTG